MADPILPDHFRVQAVFQHASGLPADRFVNTFCFRNDTFDLTDSPQEFLNAVQANLDLFYFEAAANGTRLSSLMPNAISEVSYRVYDLGKPPPREPMIVLPAATPTWGTGMPLPFEVAITLSLRTTERGPRGRGRLFIGPLTQSAQTFGANVPQPTSQLVACLVDRAANLGKAEGFGAGWAEGLTWCVLSQANQATYAVTGGYVDNAFDTQRRRGNEPTTRTTFGAYTAEYAAAA